MAGGRLAVYTGSFDPLTFGHLDVIRRAATLFDTLIVAVGIARGKTTLFSVEERLAMIREVCSDLTNVKADSFSGLAVEFAGKVGAVAMVRGVRSSADYTYEVTMAHMNRALKPGLETLFLPTAPAFSHVSSTLAKEIASYGGDPGLLCPPQIVPKLRAKLASA
jgi:pantetheine-phosphate adenylyltransferase